MLKNIFYKKKEIDMNKEYICDKKKDIEVRKKEIRMEMNRWGKRQMQRKNFP